LNTACRSGHCAYIDKSGVDADSARHRELTASGRAPSVQKVLRSLDRFARVQRPYNARWECSNYLITDEIEYISISIHQCPAGCRVEGAYQAAEVGRRHTLGGGDRTAQIHEEN
jgi:hypothetical protein